MKTIYDKSALKEAQLFCIVASKITFNHQVIQNIFIVLYIFLSCIALLYITFVQTHILKSRNDLWWANPGWIPGAHKSCLIPFLLSWAGERKCNERFMGWDKDRKTFFSSIFLHKLCQKLSDFCWWGWPWPVVGPSWIRQHWLCQTWRKLLEASHRSHSEAALLPKPCH